MNGNKQEVHCDIEKGVKRKHPCDLGGWEMWVECEGEGDSFQYRNCRVYNTSETRVGD